MLRGHQWAHQRLKKLSGEASILFFSNSGPQYITGRGRKRQNSQSLGISSHWATWKYLRIRKSVSHMLLPGEAFIPTQ